MARIIVAGLAVLLLTGPAAAQLLVRATAAPPGEAARLCNPDREKCVFSDLRGENLYTVDKTTLRRTMGEQQTYTLTIAGKGVKLLFASINKLRSQIVIASEVASVSTSAMFSPGSLQPDSVQRQYTLSIRNPKSGEEIKAINLGMLRPSALSMTASGDIVWVAGDELQLRRREVRAYNARNGKLEHQASADRTAALQLFERGFQLNATYYLAEVVTGEAMRKHTSPIPTSLAEFTVHRSAPLVPKTLADAAIAVLAFEGGTPELRDMLEGALAIKLAGAGFRVVERQRLKDVLKEAQFQNLGLTDAKKAAELGNLVNAQYLLFGQLKTAGSVSTLTLRLVGVSDGTLKNGVELECRDCAVDDYLQGLTFLLQDWIDA